MSDNRKESAEFCAGYFDGLSNDPVPPDAGEDYKQGHEKGLKEKGDTEDYL